MQRYARELLAAAPPYFDKENFQPGPLIMVPQMVPGGLDAAFAAGAFELTPVGRFSGHLWEQLELPWRARDHFLVNLCNAAPLYRERQLVVIHDAAVFRFPEGFTPRFRLLYRILQPNIVRYSRSVVTVSKFSAAEIRECMGAKATIEIIPNAGDHILRVGPDPSILPTLKLEPRRYLLAVGSANPTKNHAFLRFLEELVTENGLTLVVAGGETPRIFAQSVNDDSAWIRHIGYVTDESLRALYENALGFVFPSLYEGFGVPPLEAMHCGCPVIAANAAAIPETCAGAALYFDPKDGRSLVETCRRFLQSAQLQAELRAAGKERVGAFSWSKSAQLLAALLRQHAGG